MTVQAPFRSADRREGAARAELRADLTAAALRSLERTASGNALGELSVLLSGVCWLLRALHGEARPVAVAVPSRPAPAERPARTTVVVDVAWSSTLRAHLGATRERLVAMLRSEPATGTESEPDAYLDSVAAHGEPAMPEAMLRVRYHSQGRLWLDGPAAMGSDWLTWACDALSLYLEAVATPDIALHDVPLWRPEAREALLRMGRGPEVPASLQGSFVATFERLAHDHPDAPAVLDAERLVTYGALNAAANRLGRHLRDVYGVTPGAIVAVLLENDADAIVALLALLKIGAVYLPMEVEWPEGRVAAVVEEAGAAALLTSSQWLTGALAHIPTFATDLQLAALDEAESDPGAPIAPEATAYVVFTSGTTGKPKGIRVAHRSLFNMLHDQAAFLGMGPGERVLQPFSLAFDASLLSIGTALVSGAAVVLLPRPLLGDSRALGAFLRAKQVTIGSFVPSMLRLLSPDDLPVHTIVCGGEPLTRADVERYGATRRIVNSYGTTETTCVAAAGDLAPGDEIVLGRPVANSAVHVCNAEGELLPIGVAGEICVAGAAVAEGSLESAFSSLYRTGDLGMRRADGRLAVLGRIDRQLKINGQRIEPGEIERALTAMPGIDAAHVLPHGGALAAFVAGASVPPAGALASLLGDALPRAMVPSRIVVVPSMPLGATGKVDAGALRALLDDDAPAAAAAPESDTELRLAELWESVLGCAQPGVTADFFTLGGSSLLALQLLARVETLFSVRVSLSEFFAEPTIRGLAQAIARMPPLAARSTPATPIGETSDRASYDLSPAQLGIWLDCQTTADPSHFNVPRVFTLDEPVDAERLRAAVLALGMRHEALRTNFVLEEGRPQQRIHPSATATLELLDGLRPAERDAAIERICWTPFALERDPLLRVALLRDPERSVLAVVAHHLVCDGASMSLLLRDLSALCDGRVSALPFPHRQYTEWAAAQAASETTRARIAEWREHLAAAGARATLPVRSVTPSEPPRNARIRHEFPSGFLPRLRDRFSSPFQTAVASLAAAVRERSSGQSVAIGVPVSLRSRPELHDQIGLLLNMVVLHVDTAGAETFLDVLARAEREAVWVLERSDCPFPSIARELPSPLFELELDYRPSTIEGDPRTIALGTAVGRRETRVDGRGRKFGLDVLFTEEGDELRLDVLFDESRYERTLVEQLVARTCELLTEVAAGGNPPLRLAAGTSRRDRLRRHLRPQEEPAGSDVPIVRERRGGWTLAEQLAEEREWLAELPRRGGAVLYRDCGIQSAEELSEALAMLGMPPLRYTERSSDRREVSPLIYTSTEHPADQVIRLHTEHSYSQRWPMRIAFCCLQPAARGGETPIAPVRQMMARLGSETLTRFREEGVLYVRNLGGGLGLDWPQVFGTDDRGEVEAYCRANEIEAAWWGENRLTLRFRRPALRPHPETGQELWFNHAYFFNPASLEPRLRAALEHCAPDDLPFQTFYGSGAAIPQSVFDEVAEAYAEVERPISWRRGDLLILDNMMVAHGRRSFDGPRTVLVGMSHAYPPAPGNEASRGEL
jgi:amino acid adenylation domain-containing protein